jgi:hypothetical protein
MTRVARRLLPAALVSLTLASLALAYPKPSPYPISWELKTNLGTPKRLIVDGKGYWYVTYNVTNTTGQERVFLPLFEVLLPDGTVHRADRSIPANVFPAIKGREGIQFLESAAQIATDLRIGEDQSRDGVAIWPDLDPNAREFTLFASGFSGEAAKIPGPGGKELTLFKSLQIDYAIGGDPKFREINQIREVGRSYVMR